MRLDFCLTTLAGLGPDSQAPGGEGIYDALREAGFGGVQAPTMAGLREAGLVGVGQVMVSAPVQIDALARTQAEAGFAATIVIAGNGLEDDSDCDRFAEALLTAVQRYRHILLLENHRGSMTQDIRRTLNLIARFPELRFCADFTHWYLGHELALGDFEHKLAYMQPFIDRVDIVEGRIGSCNCAQITLESDADDRHFVTDHRRFWTECFRASLRRGREPVFAPQLLPAVLHHGGVDYPIAYAQTRRCPAGSWQEQDDRWQQSLLHCAMAKDCYREAAATAWKN